MANEQKSFQDLVKEAPPAAPSGTVSLVGMLAQSSEAGKFVLTLQDGNAVTLETASVKAHAVLGSSVGQTIVRIDVDAATLPAAAFKLPPITRTFPWIDYYHGPHPVAFAKEAGSEAAAAGAAPEAGNLGSAFTNPDIDHIKPLWSEHTYAWWDNIKLPYRDLPPGTLFGADQGPNTIWEGIAGFPGGGGGDPYQAATAAPFALATPHQVQAATLAALQGGVPAGVTHPLRGDYPKHPFADRKPPAWDDATNPSGRWLD